MVRQVARLWSIPIASDGQITFCQLKKKTNILGWFGLVNLWRHFTPGSTVVAYYIQTPKARVHESVAMESPFESPPKKNGRPSRLNWWFYIVKWYSSQPSSDGHPNSSWRWTKYQDAEACINKVPLLAIGCVRKVSKLRPFSGWGWKWCFKH